MSELRSATRGRRSGGLAAPTEEILRFDLARIDGAALPDTLPSGFEDVDGRLP